MKAIAVVSFTIGLLAAVPMIADTGLAQNLPEDRYIASRDAAIRKLKPLYDDGSMYDARTKTEDAARADLEAELRAIVGPVEYAGFGPGILNLGSLYEGDEGFGTLDGLGFRSKLGEAGKLTGKDKEGNYVEPKAHILVTTHSMFARWLRAHNDWWDKGTNNVPQQMHAALKEETFYTQAFSTGSAVIKFNELPITKPGSATFAFAMLAGRTQSEIPEVADEVYVSALANGKVYIAYSSIEPKVRVAACKAPRADRSEKDEDAFKRRCFIERAPKQGAFRDAIKQAQALLETAVGK